MAYVDQDRRAKLPTYAGVALVHVGTAYALLSGLAVRVITQVPSIIAYPVPAEKDPPPPHKQAPMKKAPRTDIEETPAFQPPVVQLPTPTSTVAWPDLPTIDTTPKVPAPIPTSAPKLDTVAVAKGDKTRWIRAEDYPPSSLRAGVQGKVRIAVTIGADGRVSACSVSGASGDAALDAATCRLYTLRARYAPGRDGAGSPIETTLSDSVTWRIPE